MGEISCVWIILRLNNNKQVVAKVARGFEVENKVGLMFL